jgi:hypothetical protein
MKTADLITSYLSNEMTPEQERQFLLSVAASDSLRLSLKSHVMLDKIVTNQIQRAHVPETVRDAIFNQMSASMNGAASLGGSAAAAQSGAGDSASIVGRIFQSAAGRFGRGVLLALLTFGGFTAGYLTHSELTPAPTVATVPAQNAPSGRPDHRSAEPVTTTPADAVPAASAAPAASAEKVETPASTSGTLTDAKGAGRERIASAPRQTTARQSPTRVHVAVPTMGTPEAGVTSQPSAPATPAADADQGGTRGPLPTINRSGASNATVDPVIKTIKPNENSKGSGEKSTGTNEGGPRSE